jgi:hypothetical protein
MSATIRATVLPPSELSTVKLKQDFIGGSSKEKKYPVFNGEPGIEALIYVEECFKKIASHTL